MADPLSVAAGGIAVASFAIQLASSVSKARRFIKDVAGCPEELKWLQEQLETINDLLDEISKLYNDLPNITVSSTPSTMQKALYKCESSVQILSQKIKEHKSVQSSQRKSQMRASLRMAWKRRDIQLYENRLSASIQYLQAAMAVSQTQLSLLQQKSLSAMTRKLDSLPDAFTSIYTNPPIQHPPGINASEAPTITSTSVVVQHPSPVTGTCTTFPVSNPQKPYFTNLRLVNRSYYKTFLATIHWIKITTKKSCHNEPSAPGSQILTEEIIVRVLPSLSKNCVEIWWKSIYGSISRGFRSYPIIEWESPIIEMCRHNDVKGLQLAFSKGQASPFAIRSDGWTLLHFAALADGSDICNLLLNCGVEVQSDEFGLIPLVDCMVIDTFRALFQAVENDLDIDMLIDLGSSRQWPLDIRDFLLSKLMALNASDHSFVRFLIVQLCWCGIERDHELWDRIAWINILKRTLRVVQDISKCFQDKKSPIEHLFLYCGDPFLSHELGDVWLEALDSAGIDVESYLGNEKRVHGETFILNEIGSQVLWIEGCWGRESLRLYGSRSHQGQRVYKQIFIAQENRPRLFWDPWIDPNEPGFLIAGEFRNWFTHQCYLDDGLFRYSCQDVCGSLYDYRFFDWQGLQYRGKYIPKSSIEDKISILEKRLLRRQTKREAKLCGNWRKELKRTVPGAWID